MKDLLDFILKNITTHPDDVKIEESTEEDVLVYTINVNAEDMGRVIGKSGKVINAIRTLIRVAAVRTGQRVRINLADSGIPGEGQVPQESVEVEAEVQTEPVPEEPVVDQVPLEPTVEDFTKPKDGTNTE